MFRLKLHAELVLTLVIFCALLFIGINVNTIGDTGDSVTHYLFSRYSFNHPHFFLHHWAKPVFVLLSSPFSQFGFNGIIFFNCLCASLTALFCFYTARNLKLQNAYLVFVFIFFSPLYFKFIFSGLTEYLFGLFLIIGIYFYTKSKSQVAIIVISFLPLVRSEGLLILGVFGILLLLKHEYKLLPLLFVGQFLYTIIGASYYKDIFWVFNKIPYAHLGSPYGSGQIFDFVHKLNYVIEKPIYLLLVIGLFSILFSLYTNGHKSTSNGKKMLVFGAFISVFLGHTIFWWLGIFNSMGLPRVLIGVVPAIALIALIGVNTITSCVNNKSFQYSWIPLVIILVCYYPFHYRPKGVNFNNALFTIPEKELMDNELIPFLKENIAANKRQPLYYSNPYFSVALNRDHFNPKSHLEIQQIYTDSVLPESIIIWDDWYSAHENGIQLEQLLLDKRFICLNKFTCSDKDRTIVFVVFKKYF